MSLKKAVEALNRIQKESAQDLLDRYQHVNTLKEITVSSGIPYIDNKIFEYLSNAEQTQKGFRFNPPSTCITVELLGGSPGISNSLDSTSTPISSIGKSALLQTICFNKVSTPSIKLLLPVRRFTECTHQCEAEGPAHSVTQANSSNTNRAVSESESKISSDTTPDTVPALELELELSGSCEHVVFVDYNGKSSPKHVAAFMKNLIFEKIYSVLVIHNSDDDNSSYIEYDHNHASGSNYAEGFSHNARSICSIFNSVVAANSGTISRFIRDCMSRVTLLYPESITSLIATLARIPLILYPETSIYDNGSGNNNNNNSGISDNNNTTCNTNSTPQQVQKRQQQQTPNLKIDAILKSQRKAATLLIDDIGASFLFDKLESHYLNRLHTEYTVWYKSQQQLIATIAELKSFFNLVIFSNAPHINYAQNSIAFSESQKQQQQSLMNNRATTQNNPPFSNLTINNEPSTLSLLGDQADYNKNYSAQPTPSVPKSATSIKIKIGNEIFANHMIPQWKDLVDLQIV